MKVAPLQNGAFHRLLKQPLGCRHSAVTQLQKRAHARGQTTRQRKIQHLIGIQFRANRATSSMRKGQQSHKNSFQIDEDAEY
jgi:hypothetical protein